MRKKQIESGEAELQNGLRTGRLTVVMPVYNEGEIIEESVRRTDEVLRGAGIVHDFVLVDDGSRDDTWIKLRRMAEQRVDVVAIRLSRNFGKEGANFAGLSHAEGDCAVLMDADMQHPPEVIPEMYAQWQQGYQVVEGKKRSRGKESFFNRITAKLFYDLLQSSSRIDLHGASDFRLMDRVALDALAEMPERLTFFRAMSSWVGFARTEVPFDVAERAGGESRFSKMGLLKLAMDGILAFSSAPLKLVTWCGVIMLLLFLGLGIQTLYMYLSGRAVEGFTTVLLLLLIIGGLVLLGLGVIGMYIARIYEEVKRRPRFLIGEMAGTRFAKAGGD